MGYDPRIDHRRSVRLPSYDYAQPGAYFVTICTYRRECLFDTRIQQVLRRIWARTTGRGCYPNDGEFVAMPNHIHGIVWISARQTTGLGATIGASRPPIRGTASPPDCVLSSDGSLASVDGSPLHSESARTFAHVQRGGLRDLVASFKTTAALAVNKIRRTPGARVWQRSYYHHIIRSEQDLRRVREYIRDNPRKWAEDPDNPINICRA